MTEDEARKITANKINRENALAQLGYEEARDLEEFDAKRRGAVRQPDGRLHFSDELLEEAQAENKTWDGLTPYQRSFRRWENWVEAKLAGERITESKGQPSRGRKDVTVYKRKTRTPRNPQR
jgi:hypothetical protein